MLRVTQIEDSGRTVLRLEGKLIGPWVAELAGVCSKAEALSAQRTLDLLDVTYADRDGIILLRRLQRSGYEFRHTPPLLCEELKS